MNHTPGPWEADGPYNFTDTLITYILEKGDVAHTLAQVHSNDEATARADSALIAAAPDLLEACKRAANDFRAYLGGDLTRTTAKRNTECLQAAITKARGED